MPGDAVRCQRKQGSSFYSPASWVKLILLILLALRRLLSSPAGLQMQRVAAVPSAVIHPTLQQLHSDATNNSALFFFPALPLLSLAQISPQLAHGTLLDDRRHHFFFSFPSQHLNEFLRLPTLPTVLGLSAVWLLSLLNR